MPGPSSRDRLADQLRDHTSVLSSLDPDAPLDDLEPLREIIGDGHVVAIGEGCHFVAEFGALRRRILRFLAERCGFTVLGFEFGLAEAIPLDRWLQGTGSEADLAGYGGRPTPASTGRWRAGCASTTRPANTLCA